MGFKNNELRCDGMRRDDCKSPVAYLDAKGFVYCRECGMIRKQYQRCRQLKPKELEQLKIGKPLERY